MPVLSSLVQVGIAVVICAAGHGAGVRERAGAPSAEPGLTRTSQRQRVPRLRGRRCRRPVARTCPGTDGRRHPSAARSLRRRRVVPAAASERRAPLRRCRPLHHLDQRRPVELTHRGRDERHAQGHLERARGLAADRTERAVCRDVRPGTAAGAAPRARAIRSLRRAATFTERPWAGPGWKVLKNGSCSRPATPSCVSPQDSWKNCTRSSVMGPNPRRRRAGVSGDGTSPQLLDRAHRVAGRAVLRADHEMRPVWAPRCRRPALQRTIGPR